MKAQIVDGVATATTDSGVTFTLSLDELGQLAIFARRYMAQLASHPHATTVPVPTLKVNRIRARPDVYHTMVVLEMVCDDGTVDGYVLPPETALDLASSLSTIVTDIANSSKSREMQ